MSQSLPFLDQLHVLYVEPHRASAAAAAVFCPFSPAAAVMTRKMDDRSLYTHLYLQRVHQSVNN